MKKLISTSLILFLFLFSALSVGCPDGFTYDEVKKICIDNNDQSVTATRTEKPTNCRPGGGIFSPPVCT